MRKLLNLLPGDKQEMENQVLDKLTETLQIKQNQLQGGLLAVSEFDQSEKRDQILTDFTRNIRTDTTNVETLITHIEHYYSMPPGSERRQILIEKLIKNPITHPDRGIAKRIKNYGLLYQLEVALGKYPESDQPCYLRDTILPLYREQLNEISKEK